jgi:GNAT superfamily N-acetyltransferase
MNISIKDTSAINIAEVIELYKANGWSSAEKPDLLYQALLNSHALITAWDDDRLIGLGNAISDGYMVVYYPHLLVHPDYHGKGVGKLIMDKFQEKYGDFHQQILVSDSKATGFYKKCRFEKAGKTESMWIYQGADQC